MMRLIAPRIVPPLDPGFRPAVLSNRAFRADALASGSATTLVLCVERSEGSRSRYESPIFGADHPRAGENLAYAERLLKFLLWQRGGWRVTVGGPAAVGAHLTSAYSASGARAFDCDLMGQKVYGRPFEVVTVDPADAPPAAERTKALGRHLEGCRIGFDLGASDRKASAVIDGEAVFSEEVPWNPRAWSDPQQHYDGINESLRRAAAHLPRVDAIGGSSAGIYVDNEVRIASLFRGVSPADFDTRIRHIFHDLQRDWGGVPFEVVNDGEVTALAGSMSLGVNAILGVAMGSSEAGGYVTADGNITDWLNELAFAPVDYNPDGPVDEWSGDRGVGALYFSQQAVSRLAAPAGIVVDPASHQAEQLKVVQAQMAAGDARAAAIFETIGVYLGYTVAHYAEFYDLQHLLILGRVTSGTGGDLLLTKAREVLATEFAELAGLQIGLPDEQARRVGQSIAAASLPELPG
ncbi:MAG: ROK family protein [Fimbriimonadaceae bacterium]|nr:ROK family protein [Fimbriimonadaceae bacterium]